VRRLHIAAVAVLAASALATGPVDAAMTKSPLPAYLDAQVSRVAVFANNQWVVRADETDADQFTGTPTPYGWGYETAGGDPVKYMWAQHCADGEQRVEFVRKVWLPGPPTRVEVHAQPSVLTQHGRTWGAPFKVVKLLVNGTIVAKGTELRLSTSDPELTSVFRRGENNLRLVVRKRANPSYIAACSGKKAPARLGIQAAIIASGFPVDLGVIPPAPNRTSTWKHVKPGEGVAWVVTFHVVNKGPSASRAGHFEVQVSHGFMSLTDLITANWQAPLKGCQVSGVNITCDWSDDWLDTGEQTSTQVLWKVVMPTDQPSNDVEQMTVRWSVASRNQQSDDVAANNSATWTVYYCFPTAKDYGCDTH
jgi:hypothetical protein